MDESSLPSPHILVVEDYSPIRQILCSALEDEGFTVASEADGPAAVAWLAQRCPALVVLDFNLPTLDGSEVAKRLHTWCSADVPIVLMTAAEHASTIARELGAVACFQKPFELDMLLATVHRLVESKTG